MVYTMTVITYRELQRISAKKLVEMLPVVVTLEGEEKFKIEVVNVNRTSQEGLPTGVHEEAKV